MNNQDLHEQAISQLLDEYVQGRRPLQAHTRASIDNLIKSGKASAAFVGDVRDKLETIDIFQLC